MCDQFRFDCIAAQGNPYVATPNLDRLVRRGISFDNAYSTCPVCAPARLTLRTGREPYTTLCYDNGAPRPMPGMSEDLHERCGDYLAREMTRRGYRTFGIGKFHSTQGTLEDMGYDEQMNTEEMWSNPEERARDAYAGFMMREHPEYNHIQQLHGERTNMYYFPQLRSLPAPADGGGLCGGPGGGKAGFLPGRAALFLLRVLRGAPSALCAAGAL